MTDFPITSDTQPQNSVQRPNRLFWLKVVLVVLFVGGAFALGYLQGKKGFVFQPAEFKVVNQNSQPGLVDYNLLREVVRVLNNKFIGEDLSEQQVLDGAIKGVVAAAGDPYTEYFTASELADFRTDLKGSFEGIGAELGKRDGALVIITPLDESPAAKAGVQPGDAIMRVDGVIASNWSVEEAVKHIRGKKGTTVKLTLVRNGVTEPIEVNIIRDTIVIKSVKHEVRTSASGRKVGYIKVSKFGDDTESLFAQSVTDLRKQGIEAVVLDLRNDPGGYLDAAVALASYWLPKDTLVLTEAKSTGETKKYVSAGTGGFSSLPTVVLLNSGSASASEILAGALRDNNAAKIFGEQSFGKGSVQEIVNISGGGGLKVTVAKWITPGGVNLNEGGLLPDTEVKMSAQDYADKKDPQLDSALSSL